MNPNLYQHTAPQPPWPQMMSPNPQMMPPNPPMTSTFWETTNVRDQLKNLQDTLSLTKAMQKELEMLMSIKDGKGSDDASVSGFSEFLKDRKIDLESQVLLSVEAANSLMAKLRVELEPFRAITHEMCPWEEKSSAIRLSNKICKSKRNKRWRKMKRKRVAELIAKEHERFDEADREADEWRAREIAKDISKRKMEDMKKIASLKAKEERKRLESELETVLIVEKLQELHSIRIDKLKKQGHFFPKEDDKFLERVRAAVEEEEHQANLAADMDAAGMPLQLLRNQGKQLRISDLTPWIKAAIKARVRKVKARQFQAQMKATLLQSLKKILENKFYRERVIVELMILWQTYLLNFITAIMAAILIWAPLLW